MSPLESSCELGRLAARSADRAAHEAFGAETIDCHQSVIFYFVHRNNEFSIYVLPSGSRMGGNLPLRHVTLHTTKWIAHELIRSDRYDFQMLFCNITSFS